MKLFDDIDRSGHPLWVQFILSVNPWAWYGLFAWLGLLLGLLLG